MDRSKINHQADPELMALMASGEPLVIISGEGAAGTVGPYTGKRTVRALKMRLTRERCGGDRWARVQIAEPRP